MLAFIQPTTVDKEPKNHYSSYENILFSVYKNLMNFYCFSVEHLTNFINPIYPDVHL